MFRRQLNRLINLDHRWIDWCAPTPARFFNRTLPTGVLVGTTTGFSISECDRIRDKRKSYKMSEGEPFVKIAIGAAGGAYIAILSPIIPRLTFGAAGIAAVGHTIGQVCAYVKKKQNSPKDSDKSISAY